ncbi:2-C-methyl-D-erythritol 2,4-cyclodiphosphate synthase [Neorhodopirellula lusitana]|uniref:2-C-methyl-D-erythritol 2,4-cyclodiphosphate synthase n=1 Tax=Neorhodopirellula lusitana TaxID=445327 RepID=A0ABY1PQ19_9BACT|nr:2-C-methyl-D-erythritol 2,4-cyclodiphosphate synthase [Neorhodopirellula lusitana]SMP42056.1 2-C-methyl-D-erythritol 2,4-cyclodiphosphate synthase [Neorhodopirellula lusitana]
MQPLFRIGLGYDSHRLGPGGPLRIGGIDIAGGDAGDRETNDPAGVGVHAIGHSDADVLLHAITDALLGAIAQGDIGRLFPNDQAVNHDRDSADFVNKAMELVAAAGYQINNLDAVILAERPKMAPHIDAMRARISQLLSCQLDCVGLKAKTGEGVDAVGRGEAIAARVVVMLTKV